LPKMLPDCWDGAVATTPELNQNTLYGFVGLRCRESRLDKVMASVPDQESYYKVMCGTDQADPFKEYRQACEDELKSPTVSSKGAMAFSRFMLDENNNPDQREITQALQYCANPAANPTVQRLKTEGDFTKNAFSSMSFKDRCTGQCLANLYWGKLDDLEDPFWNSPDNAVYQTNCAASCPATNPNCPATGY